jgi:hypothetical protein
MSIYEGGAWRPSLASLGGVLQVVTSTTSTQINITTNTFTDTTLTATITPKSVSSRIICFVNQNGVLKGNGDANNSTPVRIVFPNATTNNFGSGMGFTQTANFLSFSASFVASYTPNSTSAQTFKTQFASAINGQLSIVQDSGSSSSIVLMEVAS